MLKSKNSNVYKIVNGTSYHINTNDKIINILENARLNNQRIRLFLGDVKTGIDWLEIYDTIGTVNRSCGKIKIPLLVKNIRSCGGLAILDNCIVKITIGKKIVYQISNYKLPTLEVREASDTLKEQGYFYSVFADEKNISNHKTKENAENELLFFRGLRNKI